MDINQARLEAELQRVSDTALAENNSAAFAEEVVNLSHQQQRAHAAAAFHIVHHGAQPPPPPPPAVLVRDPEREAALVRKQLELDMAQRRLDKHIVAPRQTVEQAVQEAAAKVREAERRGTEEAQTAWEAHMAAATRTKM